MKLILTTLLFALLSVSLANATDTDNYLIATVNGSDVTYPIDSPSDFESANYATSTSGAGDYSFTSGGEEVTVARANVKSITLEIPLTRASETYFCSYLFYDCTNLTEANITFSDSDECTTVGNYFCYYMFYGCSELASLSDEFTFPQGITSVGNFFCEHMFCDCSGLVSLPENFNLPQKITSEDKSSFCYYMFYNCSALVSLPDSFNLPQGITVAGNFFCYRMFEGCSGLVSLPDEFNIPEISSANDYFCQYMFSGCSKLSEGETVALTFPREASNAFSDTRVSTKSPSANTTVYLKGNSDIFTVDGLTYGITSHDDNYVEIIDFTCDESVTIPATVKNNNNSGVEYTVTSIASNAFADCTSLKNVIVTATDPIDFENGAFAYIPETAILSVPDGSEWAYYNSDWATYFTIDGTISFTTDDGFEYTVTDQTNSEVELTKYSGTATSITISGSITLDSKECTVKSIANDAFANCTELTLTASSYIPFEGTPEFKDGFKGILTFDGDESETLKATYIEQGWGDYFAIVDDTFEYSGLYYQILSVSLGEEAENKVELIADASYSNLTSIEIPTSVSHTNFTFTVASIADDAFAEATNLTSVTVYWEEPLEINATGVFATVDGATLSVPDGSGWAYYTSDWATYFTIIGTISFTVDDFTYTLTDNTGTDVTISGYSGEGGEIELLTEVEADNEETYRVVSIADDAFENVTAIKSVKVNWATPIEISDKTFSGIENATLTVPVNSEWAYYTSDWATYFTIEGTISFTTDDGFEYTVTDQTNSKVELTKYSGTDTSITISESVTKDEKECTVKSIASDAFADYRELTLTVSSYISFDGEELSLDESFKGILICEDDEVGTTYIENGWGNYFAIEGDTFEVDGLYYQIVSVSLEEGAENKVEVIAGESYSELTSITIPTSVDHTNFTFTVASIAEGAFAKAGSLTEVIVSSDPAITLGDNAFATVDGAILYASGLEEKYASKGWTNYFHINGYAYVNETYHIDDLYYTVTATENGNTLEVIANESYENLESVVIPDAFEYNDVEFTVASIADGAFAGATNLTSVTVSWEEPLKISGTGVFATSPETATLHIDTEVAEKERTYGQSNWANYFTIDGYIEGTRFTVDNLTYEITDQYEDTVEIVSFDATNVTISVTVTSDEYGEFTVTSITSEAFDYATTPLTVTVDFIDPSTIGLAEYTYNDTFGTLSVQDGYRDFFTNTDWGKYFEIADIPFTQDGVDYYFQTDGTATVGGIDVTADAIIFTDKVEGFTVETIAESVFADYSELDVKTTLVDPFAIELEQRTDANGEKYGKLTVPDGCKDIYKVSSWYDYFDLDGEDYLSQDGLVYYTFIITYYEDEEESTNKALKATSSKYSISLEVAYVDESASEVTIPRTIDLGEDSSTTYEVTSMNADALKDCKDLVTINLEASIPAEDIEALNKVPDSVTIVLDEDELGTEYCESVKAAAAMVGIEVKMATTAIVEVKIVSDKVEIERYNILGQRISAPQRGINIVKYSDGTVEKVLVK